jgi:transposase-like protein
LTARQIQDRLKEICAAEAPPELISRVTGEVKEPSAEWRGRPLEPFCPVLFPDALRVNIRDEGTAVEKPVYLALAIRMDGQKELLGLRIERNEGARFRLGVMNELKNRGVQDVLPAAADGLTGFPEAITAVFPRTEVQLCIVHLVRSSTRFVPCKDRKAAAGFKKMYPAPSADVAGEALEESAAVRDGKYPVCTIQKIIRRRQSFSSDEAEVKLIFMGLKNISRKWTMPVRDWGAALNQFAIIYGENRVPL